MAIPSPTFELQLLRIDEVAELLGLGQRITYRLVEVGELQRVHPRPRAARITTESVMAYVEKLKAEGDLPCQSPNTKAKPRSNRQQRAERASKLKSLRARLGLGSD